MIASHGSRHPAWGAGIPIYRGTTPCGNPVWGTSSHGLSRKKVNFIRLPARLANKEQKYGTHHRTHGHHQNQIGTPCPPGPHLSTATKTLSNPPHIAYKPQNRQPKIYPLHP